MSNILSVQGLHAGYGKAEVLSGLNLELPRGSVVTVIGPNGAGKSTTLNALMGVLPGSLDARTAGGERQRAANARCRHGPAVGDMRAVTASFFTR